MALTLSKRQRILPMRAPEERRRPPRRSPEPTGDDYLIEGEGADDRPSAALRVVHGLQFLLIVLLGVLTLAIVWLLGTMFNIF
jgi:hypothetical protein